MEAEKAKMMDSISLGMLAIACPYELGIPSWTLSEMLNRKVNPIPADILLGTSSIDDIYIPNVISEYSSKIGYTFSWGVLSECIEVCDIDDSDQLVAQFEFSPTDLLKLFPNASMVEDLLLYLYRFHPIRSDFFYPDESYGNWYALSFSAEGEENCVMLRHWLATSFIPCILPDLLDEAIRIIREYMEKNWLQNESEGINIFNEQYRNQLCVEPAELSFFKE